MPTTASSVHGLPAQALRGVGDPTRPVPADDGCRSDTAAVCRHLLGDSFEICLDDERDRLS